MVREQTGRKFKQKLYHGVLYTNLTITRNSEPITKKYFPQNKTKDWLAMLANIHFPKMFLETRQCTILRNICGKRVGTHWLAIPANIHFPPMFLETWQSTIIRNIGGKLAAAGWLAMPIIRKNTYTIREGPGTTTPIVPGSPLRWAPCKGVPKAVIGGTSPRRSSCPVNNLGKAQCASW